MTALERSPELRTAGAGLGLGPNAIKGFERIGLATAILRAGATIRRAAILDSDGRVLGAEIDVARLQTEIGAAQIAIHRTRLHDALLAAVGAHAVRLDFAVARYDQRDGRVVVDSDAGQRLEADLLVGADGLRSAVRAQLVGDGEPVYAGYTSWRGITPPGAIAPPARMTESWGRGERFGMVDVGFGEIYWFAVANAAAGGTDTDVQRELLARFATWHDPIPAIIAATPASRILRTDITDRPPIECWHAGRVVLLGDAAHPMTPNLGQGACQAIEDAVVLDQCLSGDGPHEAALRRYEARRIARVNALVRASRRLGAIAQWRNSIAVWLRNTGMRLAPSSVVMAQTRRMLHTDL